MKVIRLKHLLKGNFGGVWGDDLDCNENSYTYILRSTEQNENGNWVIYWESVARRNLLRVTNFHTLKKNDIVITKSSGSAGHIGKATLVDENIEKLHCSFSNFMQCLQLDAGKCNPRFYWYYLNSRHCKEQYKISCTTSTGLLNLNSDTFNNLNVPFFSVEYQNQCVAFLDKTISKIEDAIEKHKIQLDFLSSYRQSLITRAVTKGLDPNVDCMKKVPFKRFIISRNGGMWGSEPGSAEVDALCIRVADFDYANLKTRPTASTMRSISEKQLQNNQLRDGDILLEKSGGGEKTPVGRAVYYSGCERAICSNFIERLTINRQMLNPKFACYVLSSAYSQRKNFDCIKQTTGIQNLSVDDYLSSVTVPLFDLETQQRITNWLDKQLSKVAQVITANQAQLMKLTAYRQSLISYAVTGQLAIDEAEE